jgi:hypothetical protein
VGCEKVSIVKQKVLEEQGGVGGRRRQITKGIWKLFLGELWKGKGKAGHDGYL